MWAIDLTHTSHTQARTGIQQVSRSLFRELSETCQVRPVVHDRYSGNWREPDREEWDCLNKADDAAVPAGKRSSRWSWRQKLIGRIAKAGLIRQKQPEMSRLFCPEIIDKNRIYSLIGNPPSKGLPKVALFHDAIAIRHPHWCPAKTIAHFPHYLKALSHFNHVICVSRASESDLLKYWKSHDIQPAPTSVVQLGLVKEPVSRQKRKAPGEASVILMVGTLEARKNHVALLQACEELWEAGIRFKLELAGMLNRETGMEAARLIAALREKGRPINWHGPVSEAQLEELYLSADLFAYPSLYEGFGIPVLEALAHGIPVITTPAGALAERIEGGGCAVCDGSVEGIRRALDGLLHEPARMEALKEEAESRPIRYMQEAAADILKVFQGLVSRSSS